MWYHQKTGVKGEERVREEKRVERKKRSEMNKRARGIFRARVFSFFLCCRLLFVRALHGGNERRGGKQGSVRRLRSFLRSTLLTRAALWSDGSAIQTLSQKEIWSDDRSGMNPLANKAGHNRGEGAHLFFIAIINCQLLSRPPSGLLPQPRLSCRVLDQRWVEYGLMYRCDRSAQGGKTFLMPCPYS